MKKLYYDDVNNITLLTVFCAPVHSIFQQFRNIGLHSKLVGMEKAETNVVVFCMLYRHMML